jgi:hypothetical protein
LLADALGLPEQARTLFVAAARGKAQAADVLTARRGVTPGVLAAVATRLCRGILPPLPAARPSSRG